MNHSFLERSVKPLSIYSLLEQQDALSQLVEQAAVRWSLDTQDIFSLLGLTMSGDLESGCVVLEVSLSLCRQRALRDLLTLLELVAKCPEPREYDHRWLMTLNHNLDNFAPIDLMLAEGGFGIRTLTALVKRQTDASRSNSKENS